jgi:peptidoglycan/LPS O-acetylase OafA/YrhL
MSPLVLEAMCPKSSDDLQLAVQKKGWKTLPMFIAVFLVIRIIAYYQGADMRDISYWSIIGRIDQFLIGMLAGIFYRSKFQQSGRFDLLAVFGLILVLGSLFVFNQFGGGGQNNYVWIFWPTLEAAAWALFVLGYLSIARHYPSFVNKSLVALGAVSYSIYLVHYVVLDFFMQRNLDTLLQLDSPLGTAVLNVCVIIMPLVIGISAVTYFCIERPFLIRRTTYLQKDALN